MASKAQHAHTCTAATQGLDKMCPACTQQFYFNCLARERGEDVEHPRATRFVWDAVSTLEEIEEGRKELHGRYSTIALAESFKKHRIDLEFEVRSLRYLCGYRQGKNTGTIRLRALEALQSLRREVMGTRVPPISAADPSKNGTAPRRELAKDDWTGTPV